MQVAKADDHLLKKEADLYSNNLSELNGKFSALEDHEWDAKEKAQSLREQVGALEKELMTLRVESGEYKNQEDMRWALKKEELFHSEEFYDLLGAKAAHILEKGFYGAVAQFKKVCYPPEGASLDFLDLQKVYDDILDEDIPCYFVI